MIKRLPLESRIDSSIETKLSLTFENYSKLYRLSPDMAAFMGKDRSTKREITDRIWEHCKRHSLLENAQILLDTSLDQLFGPFADELAQKEEARQKELKDRLKKQSEFKINLGQLTKRKSQPRPDPRRRLALCELNNAIFRHIVSIASFEFNFQIPPPELAKKAETREGPMDAHWSAFDVLVGVQSENINEAMPFFVQKVIFEEKEREKILSRKFEQEFNQVMVVNEQIKLDNQRLLALRADLAESFTTLNLQNQVGSE